MKPLQGALRGKPQDLNLGRFAVAVPSGRPGSLDHPPAMVGEQCQHAILVIADGGLAPLVRPEQDAQRHVHEPSVSEPGERDSLR